MDSAGCTKLVTVTDISSETKDVGVGNFVVKGFPIANGLLASVRVAGDGPDLMWDFGFKIYDIFGPLAANFVCHVGYRFIDRLIH